MGASPNIYYDTPFLFGGGELEKMGLHHATMERDLRWRYGMTILSLAEFCTRFWDDSHAAYSGVVWGGIHAIAVACQATQLLSLEVSHTGLWGGLWGC